MTRIEWALLVAIVACGGDVANTGDSTTTATSGGGGAGGVVTNGAGGANGSTGGAGGMPSTGNGMPEDCAPDPMDNGCRTCMKANCCEEIKACEMDMQCSCFTTCLADGDKSPQQCIAECGMPGPVQMAIRECRIMNCSDACGMMMGPGAGNATSAGQGGSMPMPSGSGGNK